MVMSVFGHIINQTVYNGLETKKKPKLDQNRSTNCLTGPVWFGLVYVFPVCVINYNFEQ